ncbi:MAG: hypothetical protein IPL97_11820 [Niastella sp.]|nr:hypothetical protein [Niastella sp.]
MIGYLSQKAKRPVAWLLFFLFYFDLVVYAYSYRGYSAKPAFITTSVSATGKANSPEAKTAALNSANDMTVAKNNKAGRTAKLAAPEKKLAISAAKLDKGEIGGPGQPEMTSFKAVGSDNMVNLFTGDFSYNIPLLDAGGYPINLFYNSGIGMDQEASWVGLGFNINPGTITRNMRGLPDDFDGTGADGDKITKVQSVREDLTVGINVGLNTEIKGSPLGIGANAGIFWNNRRGLGLELGGNFSIEASITKKSGTEKTVKDTVGSLTTSAGATLNSQNGLSLNAGFDVSMSNNDRDMKTGLSTSIDYNSRSGLGSLKIASESNTYKKVEDNKVKAIPSKWGTDISFARSSFTPGIRIPVSRYNGNLKIKLGGELFTLHGNGYVAGSLSRTYIADKDKIQSRPAYGYMYYEKANTDKNAMLDFNRINDGTYTLKSALISIPNYTYDVFSINGEGTGGSFRGYRGNMGYVRDNYTKSREGALSLSFDAGGGNLFHGGTEINGVYSVTEVGDWTVNNAMRNTIKFNESNGAYQSFYFKNPGEKAIIDEDYYNNTGGDLLVRPKLLAPGMPLPIAASKFESFNEEKKYQQDFSLTKDNTKKKRDKRTQVITYLTARDAEKVGLDKSIYSFTENMFKLGTCNDPLYKTAIRRYNPGDPNYYRKGHHLSEVDVLEGDGKRYIYGLPAYSVRQKDVTFNLKTGQGNLATQQATYEDEQNTAEIKDAGRDWFFQSEEVPAYAHSFLLTAILSPDYVDKTNDGISDDDLGTSVKFNYTRINKRGTNSWEPQRWRTPVDLNSAHFNEGLRTDNADDKGLYTYGEKELWYVHSIETKTMYVTFTLGNRDDGKQVMGENGQIKPSYGQKRLEKIDLYTKAEFLKPNPKPVKTVHFSYSYNLCQGVKNNNAGGGKLTLESIWFSYNGNYTQTRNKYKFRYAQPKNGVTGNPVYNSTESDRWGTYKDHAQNPNGMRNADFPYTLQPQTATEISRNNTYAAAWNLESILIPSGAVINVEYESDDYAFVQNKRAALMTHIAGFGKAPTDQPSLNLYEYTSAPASIMNPALMDNRFVFFDVQEPVSSRNDVFNKYLDGMKQLLLRIWVEMPTNSYGSGYEPINVYANIKDYGVVPGNANRIWVELNSTSKGGSPIMETVIQFLKDNLPSKAFKGYDHGNESGLTQLVYALHGLADGFFQAIQGFEANLKSNAKCKRVNLTQCFGRLNSPGYKKYGGGHRVKRILITDNWKKMTNPASLTELDATYGQIYDYSTVEMINGEKKTISSGVATYEPGIGNEENPFREVLQYREKQPLGPTNVTNVEMPITETFFPSPSVGYSKVTVRSIHNKTVKNIKSSTGKQVTEYFTARDFPLITDYTDFDSRSRRHYKPKGIMKILFQQETDYLTLSQGFRVILNDMHGKMKSQGAYGEQDLETPINLTTYHYRMNNITGNTYRLANVVKAIPSSEGIVQDKLIGKDVEIMNDFREHKAVTHSGPIPLNVDVFSIPFIPFILGLPGMLKAFFKNESLYRSATTLKIINEYGILDSVVNIDKGSEVSTKNLVYDAETGEVLISRTNNSFNKPVYNLNYPASWVNSGMDLAYKNIDVVYKNVNFANGRIEGSPHVDMANFESGDEIFVLNPAFGIIPNTSTCTEPNDPPWLISTSQTRIWAIDVAKDERNIDHSFVFLDRNGVPYSGIGKNIRIIRSGKRNMGSAAVGSVTSLKSPLVAFGVGQEKISITDNTNVLNGNVTEFKEKWRVQDAFYSLYTTVNIKRYVPVQSTTISSNKSYSINYYYGNCKKCGHRYNEYSNPGYLLARVHNTWGGSHTHTKQIRSFVHFNLDALSNGTVIKEAKLSLFPHTYVDPKSGGSIQNLNHEFIHPVEGFDGRHTNPDPHKSANVTQNSFMLFKMQRAWPANNSGEWTNGAYQDEASGYLNSVQVMGTPPPVSLKSYSGNDAIDVTGLFSGILQDRATKGYTPGIKMRLASEPPRGTEARVCFWANNLPQNLLTAPLPRVEIKYYDCANAYPVGYTPQPWEEVDSCITPQTGMFCFSVFDRKHMNPYVHGLLGNFRAWRSYVYYGERRESDFNVATNIAKDGVIKNFENYWQPAPNFLQRTNSAKWVWNSEVTQFNRKGLEIENHDPLDRYNSGVYGYLETLPIAVANNSRVREIAFDGFEDYLYKDEPCEPICKPNKRHFATGEVLDKLTTTQHHTGKYSISIPNNGEVVFNSPVLPVQTDQTPDLRIHMIQVAKTDTTVTLRGVGLKRTFYSNTNYTGSTAVQSPSMVNLGPGARFCPPLGNVPSVYCNSFSIRWTGKLQVDRSGYYSFWLSNYVDDIGRVEIRRSSDNALVYSYNALINNQPPQTSVSLIKGQLYTIQVNFVNTNTFYGVQLQWKIPGATQYSAVPSQNLYPEGMEYLATNTVVYGQTTYCYKYDSTQAIGRHLIDSFSLLANKRYVLSAWVKQGVAESNVAEYLDNSIDLTVNNSNASILPNGPAKPTGNIIEGWQRYEFDFTLPNAAESFQIKLRSHSSQAVFFDDLRIHPFNANLKSFVYHPDNLRLAAELDENNYASFYEYDDDGTLVRVKKETKDGVKTITETRSALQKNINDF